MRDYSRWLQSCKDGNLASVYEYQGNFEMKASHSGFCAAAQNGHLHIVKYMIEVLNASPYGFYANGAPMHCAVWNEHLHIIDYLFRAGCDLRNNCDIVYREAVSTGKIEILKYIYRNNKFPSHETDKKGKGVCANALVSGMKNGHWNCVFYTEYYTRLNNVVFPTEHTDCGAYSPYLPFPSFQEFESYHAFLLVLTLGYSNTVWNEFTLDHLWDNKCMFIVCSFLT